MYYVPDQADADTGNVDFTVTRVGSSSGGKNFFQNEFGLFSTATNVIDVASFLPLEANDTIIFTITQTGAPSDWCLDAVFYYSFSNAYTC